MKLTAITTTLIIAATFAAAAPIDPIENPAGQSAGQESSVEAECGFWWFRLCTYS
jgi:hypothetical protein